MLKYSFKIIACSVTVIASLTCISCSQRQDTEAVRKVVTAYCQLDYDGARLSGSSWKKIESLIGYTEEPGWDRAVVIRGFTVSQIKVKKNTATALVGYDVVGELDGAEEFKTLQSMSGQELAESQIKTVIVQLKKVNGNWKFADFIPLPRVSMQKMTEHLKDLYADEKDESRRPIIQKTIKEMGKYAGTD